MNTISKLKFGESVDGKIYVWCPDLTLPDGREWTEDNKSLIDPGQALKLSGMIKRVYQKGGSK